CSARGLENHAAC
nr:Chain P, upain-1-W3A [synthetic construct]